MTIKARNELMKLSTQEKIELIGDLWSSISESEIKLSGKQDEELDKRLKEYRAGNVKWVSADKVEKEIRRRR